MSRKKILGTVFLALSIFALSTTFATAADFFALQHGASSIAIAQSQALENMVLIFSVKFAATFALFWLGIRKFELIE